MLEIIFARAFFPHFARNFPNALMRDTTFAVFCDACANTPTNIEGSCNNFRAHFHSAKFIGERWLCTGSADAMHG